MPRLFLKPAPDRRVLNHQRAFLPLAPDGEYVDADKDVRRWLAAGDAVEAPEPATPTSKKEKPAPST